MVLVCSSERHPGTKLDQRLDYVSTARCVSALYVCMEAFDTESRRISVDSIPGIIDLNLIKTILCFTQGTSNFPGEGPEFLDGHISEWQQQTLRRRNEMRGINNTEREYDNFFRRNPPHVFGVFIQYMRSFFCLTGDETKGEAADGFQCKRKMLKISHSDRVLQLRERRYSIALNLFPVPRPCGVFTLVSVMDEVKNERSSGWEYSVPPQNGYVDERATPWQRYGILPAGLFTGISVFQLQICAFIEAWEQDWDETIAKLDDIVSVKVRNMCLNVKTVHGQDL